jgi:hypothetical protein
VFVYKYFFWRRNNREDASRSSIITLCASPPSSPSMTESSTTALSFFPSAVGIKVPNTDWQVGTLIKSSAVLGTGVYELVRRDGRLESSSLFVKAVPTMSMVNTSKRSIASEMLKKERLCNPRFVAGLWGKSYGPAYYTNVDGKFFCFMLL